LNNVKMRKATKLKKPAGSGKPAGGAKAAKPYHHGNLREKLVAATEALILEKGVDGFSLREVARRAGVSPAAPAHHFGDTKGLLTEVAMRGYADFAEVLAAADARGGSDPAKRLHEQGLAYVTFAMNNSARFALMFRTDKVDMTNATFLEISNRSFRTLEAAIRAAVGAKAEEELSPDGFGLLMAVWSIVHGFSHLALGGEFDYAARMRGGKDAILKSFLPLTLKHLPLPAGTPQKAR
jgi:AcrR family transcriptional regulator